MAKATTLPPGHPRAGQVTLPSTASTGNEMSLVLASLRHRPPKPDLAQALATIASAALAILKSVGTIDPVTHKWSISGWDLVFLVAASAAIGVALQRYLSAALQKDPLNEQAKALVVAQMAVQGLSVEEEVKPLGRHILEFCGKKVRGWFSEPRRT